MFSSSKGGNKGPEEKKAVPEAGFQPGVVWLLYIANCLVMVTAIVSYRDRVPCQGNGQTNDPIFLLMNESLGSRQYGL